MPSPTPDPSRFIDAVLADPSHKLPMPDRGGRLFMTEGELVDRKHPFYAALLADGSLKPKPEPVADQPEQAVGSEGEAARETFAETMEPAPEEPRARAATDPAI